MKRSNRKLLSTLLLLSLVLVTFTSSIQAVPIAVPFSKRCENLPVATSPDVTPAQVGLAMTPEPMTSISINWTTIDTNLSNPIVYVWKKADKQTHAVEYKANVETRLVNNSTLLDGDNLAVTEKNFYSVVIDGLKADTKYEYRCGTNEAMSAIKSFTTAPDKNGKYTFIYVSDSQIRDEHAKSWQANLDMAKKMYPQASFMYIAGDLTNTAANENEWEAFFNQPGNSQYNEQFSGSLISELPLAATMGNHDSSNAGIGGMSSHYTWASEVDGVPVSYAYNYGAARVIIMNLENTYSRDNEAARSLQEKFLRDEVASAKAENRWTIVGFHKSIYSGANHMDDSDVIFNRQYWGPKFAELNVDMVLQGHDHVLSRGFIKVDGFKADVVKQIGKRSFTAKKPANAPLYYVGNGGSTLKFYAPILNNDWIMPGDPVAPDFGYLDLNSAMPAGDLLNPLGPCTNDDLEGVDPDYNRLPTFTAVTVSKDSIEFKTYMTGFNSITNEIVKKTFLYDSFKLTRSQQRNVKH